MSSTGADVTTDTGTVDLQASLADHPLSRSGVAISNFEAVLPAVPSADQFSTDWRYQEPLNADQLTDAILEALNSTDRFSGPEFVAHTTGYRMKKGALVGEIPDLIVSRSDGSSFEHAHLLRAVATVYAQNGVPVVVSEENDVPYYYMGVPKDGVETPTAVEDFHWKQLYIKGRTVAEESGFGRATIRTREPYGELVLDAKSGTLVRQVSGGTDNSFACVPFIAPRPPQPMSILEDIARNTYFPHLEMETEDVYRDVLAALMEYPRNGYFTDPQVDPDTVDLFDVFTHPHGRFGVRILDIRQGPDQPDLTYADSAMPEPELLGEDEFAITITNRNPFTGVNRTDEFVFRYESEGGLTITKSYLVGAFSRKVRS